MASDTVEVTLRRPPPLERDLTVEAGAEGSVVLVDGDALVAEARPGRLAPDVPEPVSVAEAEATHPRSRYIRAEDHPFPTCFVCGPHREPGDGLRIFAGELDAGTYAAVWKPDASLGDHGAAGGGEVVRPEFVWASLDCPTSAPLMNPGSEPPIVLARMTARVEGPVRAGRPYVLMSWPLALDGRKRRAAAAIFSEEGERLGLAEALWIELR